MPCHAMRNNRFACKVFILLTSHLLRKKKTFIEAEKGLTEVYQESYTHTQGKESRVFIEIEVAVGF